MTSVILKAIEAIRNRKRDVSARYSAIQGPLPASPNSYRIWAGMKSLLNLGRRVGAKAGGTTRRPLVLQMDRGRILIPHGGATC